ncbi:MAG: biopolymer transporter ExbD [Spirochaetaceae bacterium]|jgi:biopolymer transport protein ExbD|nr:biopolymer transporter ExbD [Spirochaetaceae bacterium]
MMNIKRNRKQFAVPLNSMSDVAFLLLIFIMLVSLINYRREVKIEYPEAETARKTSVQDNLEIWVDPAGSLYLDGVLSDIQNVENHIISAYQETPDTRIHIIADRNTPFEYVNRVLQMLQILQYRVVSFVVKDTR